jgi:hypothetical protein
MKNRMKTSTKTRISVVCMVTALALVACTQKKVDATAVKEKLNQHQAKPQPPGVNIHTAALMGDLNAVHQHIAAGTKLNEKDAYGSTPLIIATTFGKTDIARALIEGGADLNLTNHDGSTALHVSAFLCRSDIVKILLEHGADKGLKNRFGSTALDAVEGPFESAKPYYDQISKDLGPLGLRLDYGQLQTTRPLIAELLR